MTSKQPADFVHGCNARVICLERCGCQWHHPAWHEAEPLHRLQVQPQWDGLQAYPQECSGPELRRAQRLCVLVVNCYSQQSRTWRSVCCNRSSQHCCPSKLAQFWQLSVFGHTGILHLVFLLLELRAFWSTKAAVARVLWLF